MKTTTIVTFSFLWAAMLSRAEVITWTNTSNGNWSVAANWSPNQVPSTNDIAVITNAGIYTVSLNLSPTIAGLVVGSDAGTQTVSTAGQTLTLNGSGTIGARGVFNLALGTLSGTNQVNVEGALNWIGGVINTNAAVTVAAGGQLAIGNGMNYDKFLFGQLTNNGTITWWLYRGLVISGVLHNRAGALFDAQFDGTIYQGGGGRLINDGVFRKSAGTATLTCGVPLINNGTVDTQSGVISLADGSVFNAGCDFTGAGQTQMSSGTDTINGSIHSENLVLPYGGTLAGTGSFSGTLTWSGGTIGTDAALTVATNGTLHIASAANFPKHLLGCLTNAGTILWQPHNNLVVASGLQNLPGSLFDVQVDGTMVQAGGGGFINDGVFRKSAGTGSTDCDVPFVNDGTINISTGTLNFVGAYTNPAGTIQLAGGTLRLTSQPLWLSGGMLTGWGTVWADVTNGAAIQPARTNGVLTINGNYDQRLNGRLEFELAGNNPGPNQSRLNVTGAASLRGTAGVLWENGYLPSPGTSFPVMTFASHDGEFSGYDNFFLLGQGRRLTPVYAPTTLTLSTVAAPDPTGIPLKVIVEDGSALIAWPLEFTGYELYWSTNLSQTNWIPLPAATNRWFEPSPLPPEQFFRLRPS